MSNTVNVTYCTPFGLRKGTLEEALAYATMAWDASGFKTTIWGMGSTLPSGRLPFKFLSNGKAVLV